MTLPDILRYVLDHVHSFGYQKWQVYLDAIPNRPTAQEALAEAEQRLVKQRAYVAALQNVEEAIVEPARLRPESLRLLFDYLDHPDKGGGSGHWIFSVPGTNYPNPPKADQVEADMRARVKTIREWEAAEKAIRALIYPS